jgi:hypothetical protein
MKIIIKPTFLLFINLHYIIILPSILVYDLQTTKRNTTCIQYITVPLTFFNHQVHHQHQIYGRFIHISVWKFNRIFNMIDDLTIDNILIRFCSLQDSA